MRAQPDDGTFAREPEQSPPHDDMKLDSIKKLYIEHLRDLYSAENQLVKALPQMAESASSDELKQAFEDHLEQTREHLERLEEIFHRLGEKPAGKNVQGDEGR